MYPNFSSSSWFRHIHKVSAANLRSLFPYFAKHCLLLTSAKDSQGTLHLLPISLSSSFLLYGFPFFNLKMLFRLVGWDSMGEKKAYSKMETFSFIE